MKLKASINNIKNRVIETTKEGHGENPKKKRNLNSIIQEQKYIKTGKNKSEHKHDSWDEEELNMCLLMLMLKKQIEEEQHHLAKCVNNSISLTQLFTI